MRETMTQGGPMTVDDFLRIPTAREVSGQVPAVVDADYKVINENLPAVVPKRDIAPVPKMDRNSATEGKSVSEAIAYHLACLDALRNGDSGKGVDPPKMGGSAPGTKTQDNAFTRIKNAFD